MPSSVKWQNLLDIAYCAKMVVQQEARMLCLPECFGFMGSSAKQTVENAERLEEAEGLQDTVMDKAYCSVL